MDENAGTEPQGIGPTQAFSGRDVSARIEAERESVPRISDASVDVVERIPELPGTVRIEELREGTRGKLSRQILWIFAGFLMGIGILLATKKWTSLTTGDLSQFFTPALTALIALSSTAVGFYFGKVASTDKDLSTE